jgi:hypothetical protein
MYLCKIDFHLVEIATSTDETVVILSIFRPAVLYLNKIHVKLIGLDIISP